MARLILYFALTLAVLEGGLRKWVIGSETSPWSYVAYFSKDILFAGLLLLPRRLGTTPALERFRRSLLLGGGMICIGAAVACSRGFNFVGGGLTLRATVFLPLIAYWAVPRLAGLRLLSLATLLAVLTCLNCGLGIVQNHLPVDDVLNRYAASEAEVSALESGVRATGTFSYITGLALLSSIGIWAGIVLLSCGPARWWEAAAVASILAGIACGLASVSRGPLIIGGLLLASWACFTPCGRIGVVRMGWALGVAGAAAAAVGLVSSAQQMATAVADRHEQGEDSFQQRVFGQLSQTAAATSLAPLGQGLGTEQVAANYSVTGMMKFTTFEEQMPRLILETGVLGGLGFLIICTGAITSLQAVKRIITDLTLRAVLLATQLLLACMFYTNVAFNHTASAFAWMIFAAVMASVQAAATPLRATVLYQRSRNHFHRARFAR